MGPNAFLSHTLEKLVAVIEILCVFFFGRNLPGMAKGFQMDVVFKEKLRHNASIVVSQQLLRKRTFDCWGVNVQFDYKRVFNTAIAKRF